MLGLPCARAPRPSAATCGPGQPVPGSCPASPSAAAGLAVPPAITLQSLRRRHRRQFCSPQPWQLRARASSIRRRRHLTPRAGQRHQPLTARPNIPSLAPSPPAPPIRLHLSSSANAAAAPRQRPGRLADLHAQPCPPLPTRLDRSADSSTSSHHRVSCLMKHDVERRRKHIKGLVSKKNSRRARRACYAAQCAWTGLCDADAESLKPRVRHHAQAASRPRD